MALSQPQDPALKRFAFFVSRRLEDGRERFRLHMGYFETLQEAEEWVGVVREFYPGAWAGEAPGKRLRAREQPAAASAAPLPDSPALGAIPVLQPAPAAAAVVVPKATSAPAPAAATVSAPAPTPAAAIAPAPTVARPIAPTVSAPAPSAPVRGAPAPAAPIPSVPSSAPVAAAAPVVVSAAPAASVATGAPATTGAPVVTGAQAPTARAASTSANATAGSAGGATTQTAAAKAGTRTPKTTKTGAAKSAASPTAQLSNVREVMAALDETDATREMPVASTPRVPRVQESDPERGLSDTQVLKLLESRQADGKRGEPDGSISLLKPDDSGTRRALKEAVALNAPVSFAVQLQWSVQPIDVASVPPLAIFSAYTLYTVEGSREGRRWFGLRLGFFSDAISAKQVAHYVRSEFNSVAVVPVSPQERTRACDAGGAAGAGAATGSGTAASAGAAARPQSDGSASSSATSASSAGASKGSKATVRSPVRDRLPEPTAEFKLFEDEPTQRAPQPKQPPAKARTAARASTKRAAKAPGGRVRAREKRAPQTLEETLEILGADELEIEEKQGATVGSHGVQPLKAPQRKNSPFTKLLDRLAERSRKDR